MITTLKNPLVQVADKLRYWSLTTYATAEHIRKALSPHESQIKHAFYIFHDKDVNKNEDGTEIPKETHAHINLVFTSAKDLQYVLGLFKTALDSKGELCNTLAKPTLFAPSADLYMTHKVENEDVTCQYGIVGYHDKHDAIVGKFQYIENDIVVLYGDRTAYVQEQTETATKLEQLKARNEAKKAQRMAQKQEGADECESMIEDILAETPHREMARRYGRDYMRNHQAYKEYCARIVIEESGDFEKAIRLSESWKDQFQSIRDEGNIAYGRHVQSSLVAQWAQQIKELDARTGCPGVVSATMDSLLTLLNDPNPQIFNPYNNMKKEINK